MNWPFVTRKRMDAAVAQIGAERDRDREFMTSEYTALLFALRACRVPENLAKLSGSEWRRVISEVPLLVPQVIAKQADKIRDLEAELVRREKIINDVKEGEGVGR